ncbi:MAG: DUF1343 domain-containing protein [Sphingobacteriales bacterium]|nr:DUF1343 domain-containing protein [Sphingobacteriales bacterium]MBI3720293.1 DUF1343 domain-containing protein [Sphingobacteriales bacterium]
MKTLKYFFITFIATVPFFACSQYNRGSLSLKNGKPTVGAERTDQYLPLLKGKLVAVFANQTSMIGKDHLVDMLLKNKVRVMKIFTPEHGFRGTADAGEQVSDDIDFKTGLPIVSLYGNHSKPTAEDLKDIEVIIFDIQDVGVRFYTYISSLEYLLEAAYENNKHLIILDRPNPNGYYVDGPVLDKKFKSFIGMQPVPVVYGMTMGEYAQMILYEQWIDLKSPYATAQQPGNFELTVIPCNNYSHKTLYELPVNPSPNLNSITGIYWYPSTCFFEGTALSEGRGTDKPFQIFGHPSLPKNLYSFTPKPNPGAKSSKLYGQLCYGWNVSDTKENVLNKINGRIQLSYLLNAYKLFPNKDSFFLPAKSGKQEDYFFNKLAGNATLMQQIKDGKSEEEIRKSWQANIQKFKAIRKKYLLYNDFE